MLACGGLRVCGLHTATDTSGDKSNGNSDLPAETHANDTAITLPIIEASGNEVENIGLPDPGARLSGCVGCVSCFDQFLPFSCSLPE